MWEDRGGEGAPDFGDIGCEGSKQVDEDEQEE